MQKAPELDLVGIKKLKIEKFECSGELNGEDDDLVGSLLNMALKAGVKKITGIDLNKVREKRHDRIADYHLNTLKNEIRQRRS